MTNFYVYYSYEQFGKGYIGVRKCNCEPEQDTSYFGSYRDKTFKPTEKVILETFESYELALEAEIQLHRFFQVAVNPKFVNRSCQKTTGFSTEGTKLSKETREKMSRSRLKFFEGGGKQVPSMLGKRHSEETKRKMSETTKLQTFSKETREKMSKSASLRKPTEEEKKKISQTLKSRPKLQCPICGKIVTDYRMKIHMKVHRGDRR